VHRCCARRAAPKPLLIVQDVNGRLYGTTYQSSHNDGSVFSLGVFPGNTFSTTQLSYGIQALNETSAARTVTVSDSDGVTLAISSINPTATSQSPRPPAQSRVKCCAEIDQRSAKKFIPYIFSGPCSDHQRSH